MAFSYISDLYGKFRRGKQTRFSEIERKAKSLMQQFVNGKISNKDFAKQFKKIGDNFNELISKGNTSIIDEDTPLWLNSFLGLHFIDWYRFQKIDQYFIDHPKELYGERLEKFRELMRQKYTDKLKKTCRVILSELKK